MSGTQSTASTQAVTPGSWITTSVNGMQYEVLLPANYNPAVKYSTTLYLHALDMGLYPTDLQNQANGWFNTVAFRSAYPTIVVMPLLDQSADQSGQTINWGGVSTADTTGETHAIAALKQVLAKYSTDPTRVYVTGNSMGGIGTEDMLIKYNAYTGTEGKIFAAGLALAGADYGQGYPQPNQSVVTGMKNVPFWAIHGGQDTQVPLAFDQNLYAAEQAIGGKMKYTQDNSLGHDVWDTYYPQTGPNSPLGWLMSQSTGGKPPTITPSANNTVVMAGSTAAITDAAGNKWTITAGKQVAVNGVTDTTTSGVQELAYVNGTVWQENASKLWWGKTSPSAAWSPDAGTATSPLPATPPKVTPSPNDTVVMAGSTAAITDAAGNKWTITAGKQVAVNGVTDTTTSGVQELAYVNGTVWQENAAKLWWGKTSPTAAWSPDAGTATSPLPATPPKVTPSPNDTVVMAGSTTAITDAAGNKWTITAGKQVAVNGVTDTTTANVQELAYVNGTVWQENASKLWWGKTSPTAPWSPDAGTATSPLPAATAAPETTTPPMAPATAPGTAASPNNTTVYAGATTSIKDASGNTWTINSAHQVVVNGAADTTTANVLELAYVNGRVWQENASKLWWGKTSPSASWAPGAGTSVSPLPAPVTLSATQTDVTVTRSQISIAATTGSRLLFISGSGDTIAVSGGTNTITDSGHGNTYVLPGAGKGSDVFTTNILAGDDWLDLRPALAAAGWNGTPPSLSNYLHVTDTAQGATIAVSGAGGGAGAVIASIQGATTATLHTVLSHALT